MAGAVRISPSFPGFSLTVGPHSSLVLRTGIPFELYVDIDVFVLLRGVIYADVNIVVTILTIQLVI